MLLLDTAYLIVFLLLSPWLLFLFATRPAVRAGLKARFSPDIATTATRDVVWLHGASAGEIGLLKPLVEVIEAQRKNEHIVLSAFAVSGYTAARRLFPQHTVIYFPADLSFVTRRFLQIIDPKLIVLVESELWPNFIDAASRAGLPVCVVNARMSEKSFDLHRRFSLIPAALKKITLLAAQSQEDGERFLSLGVPEGRLHVTGNMKYDLIDASDIEKAPAIRADLRRWLGIGESLPVFIAASIHRDEDEAVAWAYRKLLDAGHQLRLVVVPRYPEESGAMSGVLAQHGLNPLRKTALDNGVDGDLGDASTVLLVDTLGELQQFYAMSDIAFVGGSLHFRASNKGGHNMMEPAIFGVAVMFGPHYYSFREMGRELLAEEGAFMVDSREALYSRLTQLLDDAALMTAMGERARDFVLRHRGAAARNLELLKKYLP